MPLNFGKVGAALALITVAAFVLWLLFTSFFASETVEEDAGQTSSLPPPSATVIQGTTLRQHALEQINEDWLAAAAKRERLVCPAWSIATSAAPA